MTPGAATQMGAPPPPRTVAYYAVDSTAGWLLYRRRHDLPGLARFWIPQLILGILLGNAMEVNLRRELTISDGNLMALFDSPLAITLWLMAIGGFLTPIGAGRAFRRPEGVTEKEAEANVGD